MMNMKDKDYKRIFCKHPLNVAESHTRLVVIRSLAESSMLAFTIRKSLLILRFYLTLETFSSARIHPKMCQSSIFPVRAHKPQDGIIKKVKILTPVPVDHPA
jgi:hypothetical protein